MADASLFSALRAEFYARGFSYLQDQPDGTTAHTRANRFLNQGYMDVLAADDWPFLLVSRSATAASSLILATSNTGMLKTMQQVVDTTNRRVLLPINRNDIPEGQITLAGIPTHYYIERAGIASSVTVKLWPVGNTDFTCYYYLLPEPLSADGDQSVIPQWYESSIIQFACAYAYMDADSPAQAAVARAEGDRIVLNMRMNLMWEGTDYPQMMQQVVGGVDSFGARF